MNCSNHGEREAVGMCVRCHKLICEECKVKINNKYYCKECVSEMYSDNNSNNKYNNGSTINSDKFKEYADKAANAAFEVTDKISQNKKIANYVLGIIAIILLVPKVINNISSIPYFFEELIFSSRYYGLFSTMFYIIEFALSFIEPIIIIALASLLFNNFMKLKRNIRMLAPVIIVAVFTLIRFVSANIAFSYFNFHVIWNMFSYFILVMLLFRRRYLEEEE